MTPATKRTRGMRPGFTLIELLMVVAIIGVVVALVLPAILAARSAARRTQCLNNMKQLSTAILNQQSRDGVFPASGFWDPDPAGGVNPGNSASVIDDNDLIGGQGWNFRFSGGANGTCQEAPQLPVSNGRPFGLMYSWALQSLPFLERYDIYESWDFTDFGSNGSYLDTDSYTGSTGTVANDGTKVAGGNAFLARQNLVATFVCPADITAREADRGHLSYVVNGGFSFHWMVANVGSQLNWNPLLEPIPSPAVDPANYETRFGRKTKADNLFRMGLMFLDTTTRSTYARKRHSPDTIKDGLSQTIMMTENVNSGFKLADPTGSPPPPPTPAGTNITTCFQSNWACPHPFNTSFIVNGWAVGVTKNPSGSTWIYDYSKANLRGPRAPGWEFPEVGPAPVQGGINGELTEKREGGFPYPNSYHSGGVNIAMCDGSVRFLNQDVAPQVWARLVTPDGGRVATAATTVNGPIGTLVYEKKDGTGGVTQITLNEDDF